MKFSCKTPDFLKSIQLVSRAISGQQALPILGNIKIEVEGKRCTLSATDLELSIITSLEAKIENEGAITVPAKAILNFAQYNSDPEVLFETSEGTQLKCTSARAKTLISGEAASEYPIIAPVKKHTSFTLDPEPLLHALNLVTFTCARTTLRPVLSGVYLQSEKDNLVIVGTDSYRLSEYRMPSKVNAGDVSCIVPVKVLEELKVVLGGKKSKKAQNGEDEDNEDDNKKKKISVSNKVEVTLSSQQIEITIGHTHLLSRLIEGKFPDYNQIIPQSYETKVLLPTKELTTGVRRMHYFAKEINNNLSFTFSKTQVLIHTPQTQSGKDEETLNIDVEGKDNKITLSSSYLLDFLGHIEEEGVEMSLTDNMHPAVFRFTDNPAFLHLIMPLRAQE